MTRRVLAPALAFAVSALLASPAAGQVKQAAPTTPAPAAKAKWIPPVKGLATVEVIRGVPKRVGNDVLTTLKIRNTSKGAIALLGVEEFWYNQKREPVSGDSQKVRRLLNPGEVVEVTTKSPWKKDLYTNQFLFTHANGKIEAKLVKKFD